MSSDIKDDFADVIAKEFGMFDSSMPGGGALSQFESVEDAVTPQGVVLQFRCQGCDTPLQHTLEYPEVVALRCRVSPHMAFRGMPQVVREPSTWAPQGHKWFLQDRHPRCRWKLRVELDAREPDRFLKKAMAQGYLGQAQVNQLAQHCQQVYGRLAGGARR